MIKPNKKYTLKQVRYVLDNMHLPNTRIAKILKLTPEQVKSIYKLYGLKKINQTFKDTSNYSGTFKGGEHHPRFKPVGSISLRSDGWYWIKGEKGWIRVSKVFCGVLNNGLAMNSVRHEHYL